MGRFARSKQPSLMLRSEEPVTSARTPVSNLCDERSMSGR